ncbi:S-(hydroxymethyl)glutathione dehydrogenase/alcohol dehydrogenase [Antricoccus suffuscus]|uniref:S-(Hydroxymethyl)glutathione dehydrogenase/alcohol dehydrogenase n=1 Tax=Antricoccus suffuscus TaxID=1629062 RepID=A0A2T0ZZ17_9ACTN|nr:NDMA-dependent alcohol dehydrogenase [Antricoccus suffuscus]PRZ41591.1 S-(hydroxymethyl)glutathione dehydrogenase/alcohol dehydrogenase [Antricoccus suffuscus]
MIKSQAAILRNLHEDWSVEEITLDSPKHGEVLVELAATGLCHSNEHIRTGDLPGLLPMIPGHEGAGVVQEIGPGVDHLKVGDHVVTMFVPSCGRCEMCVGGHQNLCDSNASIGKGLQLFDGTARHHAADGTDLATESRVGSGARHTVLHSTACVKIPDDIPLNRACLLGCGVVTGFGSAVYAGGGIKPGETAIIVGAGGVGANAVQGARLAGAEQIVAVDPVPWKLEQAKKFGATHGAASLDEAFELVREITHGTMGHQVIMTMGVGDGSTMMKVSALVGKRGRIIITNIHPAAETQVNLSMMEIAVYEKQIHGSLYGSTNPRSAIPRLLRLYRNGQLDLDGLVTKTYSLEQINEGFTDMLEGRNIRGVIEFSPSN